MRYEDACVLYAAVILRAKKDVIELTNGIGHNCTVTAHDHRARACAKSFLGELESFLRHESHPTSSDVLQKILEITA